MTKSSYRRATDRSRHRIQKAFAELLSEYGSVKNITVTNLAERADITRGTFYNYYNNIYEVGAELQGEIESRLFYSYDKLTDFVSIEKYIDDVFDFLGAQEQIYRELLTSNDARGFLNKLENEFSARVLTVMRLNKIESKEARLELLFLANGTMAVLRKYFTGETELTLDQIKDYLKSKLCWLFDRYKTH